MDKPLIEMFSDRDIITSSPKIFLTGDEFIINNFIDYANSIPDYFVNIGVEMPTFINMNFSTKNSIGEIDRVKNDLHHSSECRIFDVQKILLRNSNSYADTMDLIMIHYV